MSSTSVNLNNDVLLYILSISPPKTATSIMATCSFLYHEGAKVILQDPIILMDSEERSLAVLRFIQAEGLSRCSYVRRLHITNLKVPESVAQILADILPRMTGLKRLTLYGDLERMFESYPYLLPTFAALRTLDTLMVVAEGERSCEMIRTLQSELSFVGIHFPPIEPSELSIPAASHPILMLQRSASSLTELWCSSLFDINPELTFSSPKVIYPNLHTLRLHHNYSLNPLPFIKAFPNLVYLFLDSALPRGNPDFVLLQFHREANLALQPPSQDGTPFGWKHLWKYTGHLVDLWVLGLTCRIPRLFLEDTPSARPPLALADVLAYAQPTSLTITFENQPLTDVLTGGFLLALRSNGAASLRCLAFIIDLMPADRNLDVGVALNALGFALSGLQQLCDLHFAVCDIGLSDDSTSTASFTPASPATASDSIVLVDVPTMLVRNVPQSTTPFSTDHTSMPLDSTVPTQDTAAAPLVELNLAERTLDAFDVPHFVARLLDSMPSVCNATIVVERPRRCGGRLRIGLKSYLWHNDTCTWQHMMLYMEPGHSETELQQLRMRGQWAAVIKGWNTRA